MYIIDLELFYLFLYDKLIFLQFDLINIVYFKNKIKIKIMGKINILKKYFCFEKDVKKEYKVNILIIIVICQLIRYEIVIIKLEINLIINF